MAIPRSSTRLGLSGLLLCAGVLVACGRDPTPAPPPMPTPRPTPTQSAEQSLESALFAITFNDVLIGTEELHTGQAEDQMVVFGEAKLHIGSPFIERRSMVVSAGLSPLRYDLERNLLGMRSTWSAERRGGGMDCLNNNANWIAPVLFEGVAPPPDVMLESFPSALPFALLALRYTGPRDEGQGADTLRLNVVDILEDHPVSRELTVGRAPDRAGAVIGTIALEGRTEGGRNPVFTMWIRSSGRSLFSVEVPDYRFGIWDEMAHPLLREPGKLVIKRVASLPALGSDDIPEGGNRLSVGFASADGTRLDGTLVLPEGQGPFPCVVVHGPGGVTPRMDAADLFSEQGWAVYSYDQRGVGASEGDYSRGGPMRLAKDIVSAIGMLAGRDDIDAEGIVFFGLGEGGEAGAVALSLEAPIKGAILGSCASVGPLFPGLAVHRIDAVLTPLYEWDGRQAAEYRENSVEAWQGWLFDGEDQVSLLRRRITVRNLSELSDTDLSEALKGAQAPVLLLHGGQDRWTPLSGAQALARELDAAGGRVELQVFPELGADLGLDTADRALAPEVAASIVEWLGQFSAR